jgi:hippurate hydrolase
LRPRHVRHLARGRDRVAGGTKDVWHGTLMAVFHPREEVAAGAQAMIDDELFERFSRT